MSEWYISRDHSIKLLHYLNKYRALNQGWTSQHELVTHVSIISIGELQDRSHHVISVVNLILA
jgi:hypothetical protein